MPVICAMNLLPIQYPCLLAIAKPPSNLIVNYENTLARNSADSLHSFPFVTNRKVKWKIYLLNLANLDSSFQFCIDHLL